MQLAEASRLPDDCTSAGAPPAVSCVVVAFHRPDHVKRLVRAFDDPRIELIVVNIEGDARIGALGCQRIVAMPRNLGYAAAVNAGVASSTAGVVVFMNDDVVTTADDVLRLSERVSHGQIDVAVPLVANSHGTLELGNRMPLRLARRMLLRGFPVPTEPLAVDAAWTPLVAVRADLVRAVPMSEAYFMYWEEFDWFYRLRGRGARVEVNPAVRIEHDGGPAIVRANKQRLLARNAVRCVRLTRGRAAALRAWPVVVLWQLQRLGGGVVRWAGLRVVGAHAAGLWAALGAWREL